jgi:transketolase
MVEFSNKDNLVELSRKIRLKSLELAHIAGKNGAHLGAGLSLVEVFSVLYGSILKFNSGDKYDLLRDRVIISKGHCVLSYYSILNYFGFLSDSELKEFESNGAFLHGHATRDVSRGIEFSGGSLGLGMSYSVGVALNAKRQKLDYKVYVIIGDGECNEGVIWESVMSASHYKLDNLIVIVDHNKLQYDGDVSSIMNMGSLKNKFESFGFFALEIDGHSEEEIERALRHKENDLPIAIIANTIKGKGISFMENRKEWHHAVLSEELYIKCLIELNQL